MRYSARHYLRGGSGESLKGTPSVFIVDSLLGDAQVMISHGADDRPQRTEKCGHHQIDQHEGGRGRDYVDYKSLQRYGHDGGQHKQDHDNSKYLPAAPFG